MHLAQKDWLDYSEVYAFLGNSFLSPMTRTSAVGLDAQFWLDFPSFGNKDVRGALESCARCVSALAKSDNPVQDCAVEYTRLFIGPPSPAAPPWETMYRGGTTNVGFGQATSEMRKLLCAAGLALQNENHQYEDHLGIELLYLSHECRKLATGQGAGKCDQAEIVTFIKRYPLSWIEAFRQRVRKTAPDGYFDHLLVLTQRVLRAQTGGQNA